MIRPLRRRSSTSRISSHRSFNPPLERNPLWRFESVRAAMTLAFVRFLTENKQRKQGPMTHYSSRFLSALAGGTVALAVGFASTEAQAAGTIKNPGDHPDYSVELEPHGIIGWGRNYWGTTGFGLGMHAVIPFFQNGPIDTINNNMGIGFGLDWVHYTANCNYWAPRGFYYGGCNADGNSYLFPVFVQWNFFFTKIISVYGEAGLFIAHDTFSYDGCQYLGGYACSISGRDTGVAPWFPRGGRVLFGDTVGLNV